jgi:2-C-methyl-D-erythritol 4-phosphate cytidylyltransferase
LRWWHNVSLVPVWGVVVAAGASRRFGRPKQLERLGDRRVLDWSLAGARAACDGVVLVVAPGHEAEAEVADAVVEGAVSRPGSVRRGLAAVPDKADVIVVHDAARPLATGSLYVTVVEAVRAGADGAVCALPVGDTLKRVERDTVVDTVDRTGLWAVQTPQAFRAPALRRAHQGEPEATDDAALVERTGGRVVVVPGDPRNLKITRPEDLAVAEALLVTLG